MLNNKHHYTKIEREVNTQFSLFRKKASTLEAGGFAYAGKALFSSRTRQTRKYGLPAA